MTYFKMLLSHKVNIYATLYLKQNNKLRWMLLILFSVPLSRSHKSFKSLILELHIERENVRRIYYWEVFFYIKYLLPRHLFYFGKQLFHFSNGVILQSNSETRVSFGKVIFVLELFLSFGREINSRLCIS